HPLEAWGDARAFDGTVSMIQPLIAPLYTGKSAHQIVAALRGRPDVSGLDLLRASFRDRFGRADFDSTFRRALEHGFVEGTAFGGRRPEIAVDAARRAVA